MAMAGNRAHVPSVTVRLLLLLPVFLACTALTHAQVQAQSGFTVPEKRNFAAQLVPWRWTKLTQATMVAGAFDIETTQALRRYVNGQQVSTENNPLAQPFAFHRERAYPVMIVGYAALGAIAGRMKRSEGWQRHVWWVPQTFAIGAHIVCGVQNIRANERD
jgi:hypothetical protein